MAEDIYSELRPERQEIRLMFLEAGETKEELKARLPYADLSKFGDDPSVDKIGDLYTVEMLVQYVQSKLAA